MMPGTVIGLAARKFHVACATPFQSDALPVHESDGFAETVTVQVISPPETIEISSTEILRMTSTPWLYACQATLARTAGWAGVQSISHLG
jgi:hypothetical protein